MAGAHLRVGSGPFTGRSHAIPHSDVLEAVVFSFDAWLGGYYSGGVFVWRCQGVV